MLLLGAVITLRGAPFEFPHDGLVDVTNHELSHAFSSPVLAMLAAARPGHKLQGVGRVIEIRIAKTRRFTAAA
jgi:hypothetical protein